MWAEHVEFAEAIITTCIADEGFCRHCLCWAGSVEGHKPDCVVKRALFVVKLATESPVVSQDFHVQGEIHAHSSGPTES